jgi:autotransporter-associated beta strand protein
VNSIRSYQQALALALPVTCLLTAPASAQSTWNGGTSTDWANAANWSPGIPASGANITIADSTVNGLTLDSSRSIGSLTFGTTGTRINGFTVNTTAAHSLAINGGIVANGLFTTAGLALRGHFTIPTPQTWTVAGSNANNTDQGVFVREVTTGVTNRGSLILSSNLTKNGAGQLLFAAIDITGPGNLIVDAGGVKYNAGASQPLVIAGPGNITLNNASTLAIYKNSGTMVLTRPIVMNGTSSLITRNNTVDIASPVSFGGTHTLDAGGTTNLTAALTGAGTVNRIGGGTLTLSGTLTDFTGTFSQTAGTTNLNSAFGGHVAVGGGTLTANASTLIAGNATVTAGTANLNGGVTGNVAANGGTINLSGSVGGTLVLAAGASLTSESTVTGGITLNGGTLSASGATPGSLSTPGNLVLTGTNTINLTAGPTSLAPFPILSYGGTLTGDISNLTLAGAANYRSPVFDDDVAGVITLSAVSESRTWVAGTEWDLNTSLNWLEGDQRFLQLDAVTFTDAGAGSIALTGVLNPLSITIDSDLDYTFTSAGAGNLIAGGAPLVKSGLGTLTLGGPNTFSGPITVNEGILRPTGNQALGLGPKTITIAAGATLDTNGAMNANRDYDLVVSGAGGGSGVVVNSGANHNNGFRSLTLTDDATIGGTGRWDLRPITAGTVLLDLDGNTLTKIGTNFIAVVDGEITSSGVINVNEGTFAVTRCVVNGTDNVNVNNGATLLLENYNTGSFNRPIALNASTLRNQGATFTLGSNVSISGNSLISVGSGVTFTIPTALTGTGNLEKTDTGTLLLTADNSYTGTTTVSAGNLIITGDNSDAGDTHINNGILAVGTGGTSGEISTNPITLGSTTAGIRFNRSDDITITNVISGSGITGNDMNPSAINKDGANTLTLSAANTYTGTFRLNGGTVVIASDASVFGDPSGLIDLRGNAASGIRSSDASPRTIPNLISYSNTTTWGSPGTGKLTLSGAIAYGGASKAIIVNSAEMEISGVIAGTGVGTNLTKDGPGLLIFSGDNTYSQNTVVSQGILQIGNGGTTGTFGSGAVTNNASLVIHRSLPEEVTELNIGNLISGTGTLTHSGPAFTILSAANTYTGDTIINDGTLSPSFAFFADTAAVRLSGDGTVDLFHAATDVIDRLYIDGVAQAAGMWGRIGSITELGADFESALITGDGLLSVTNSGSPFSEWAGDQGLTAGIDGEGDDPDQDGQDNLTEFALDGNPQSGASSGKVVGRIATVGGEQVLTLTLPVRTTVGAFSGANALSAAGDGVTYTIEGSDDLGSWLLDIDEVTGPDAAAIQAGLPALSSGDWTYRTFRSPGPVTGDPSDFLRARIE